ncbi:MAG TPA: DUF1501 domain-containing protein [Pirellulaceae bacterium]|jgi:hypothetical protein|nr:DUF1501 domain-containing protein [Pirellulaceae bacterium]
MNPTQGRRSFLQAGGIALGSLAFAQLSGNPVQADAAGSNLTYPPLPNLPHFRPKAKRVIYLFQSGGPSQIDLFDPKPELVRRNGQEIPAAAIAGQRLTTMTAEQSAKPIVGSPWKFERCGKSGLEISELLPHLRRVADDICLVRSLQTEAINHDPGITLMQTGHQQPGRPSMGSWVTYGLGSEAENLPAFLVLVSGGKPGDQPLYQRLWSSAFLPSRYDGLRFQSTGDPAPYLSRPGGVSRELEARLHAGIASVAAANEDAATLDDLAPYELAFKMQASIPDLVDFADESEETLALYGDDVREPGSYAGQCLLARRAIERGVRFVQLYHRGWDHHKNLPARLPEKCELTDRASAALVTDLKRRGLLDETMVVWAGEFGRTAYCQGELTKDDFARDHHPRCFSAWIAGGGFKSGFTYGQTDDFSCSVTENPVHVHDLQATMLHALGVDHLKLLYRREGRDYRLTDVGGRVIEDLLA